MQYPRKILQDPARQAFADNWMVRGYIAPLNPGALRPEAAWQLECESTTQFLVVWWFFVGEVFARALLDQTRNR